MSGALRTAAITGLVLGLAGLAGACHDRYVDVHVDCSSGTCVCTGLFDDCDGDVDTGCETDVSSDPENCGGCGNACDNGVCHEGSCSCGSGFVDCDGLLSNGCEAELAFDPKNCGSCGHDCQGGTCSGGNCLPLTLVGLEDAVSLAVYEDYAYIARCGEPAVAKLWTQEVGTAALPAADFMGCASTVAARGGRLFFGADAKIFTVQTDASLPTPNDLSPTADVFPSRFFAVTDAHLYFWNDDTAQFTQAFARLPINGGTVEAVADAVVTALAVDADTAYWSDQNGLHKWGTSDASPTDIDPVVNASALAVSGSTLFVATTQGISERSLSGGSSSQLATAASALALAVNATHVYWADGSDGTVHRIGRDGTGEVVLAQGEGFGPSVPFALDASAVYWIAGQQVRRVAR